MSAFVPLNFTEISFAPGCVNSQPEFVPVNCQPSYDVGFACLLASRDAFEAVTSRWRFNKPPLVQVVMQVQSFAIVLALPKAAGIPSVAYIFSVINITGHANKPETILTPERPATPLTARGTRIPSGGPYPGFGWRFLAYPISGFSISLRINPIFTVAFFALSDFSHQPLTR